MSPALPGFHALRAFEAAARHLSYSRAAEELALTHGAISHHVSRLEKDLGGVRLFVRDGQRMLLTDAGQTFVIEVREGLRILSEAMENARTRPRRLGGTRQLAISVHPAFAARWLVPRLGQFQLAHPDIEVAIHPAAALATLDARDGIHLALRYGPGRWPGLHSVCLMKSFLTPVCSPVFQAGTRLRTAQDLLRVALLRNPRQKWRPWFLAAGLDADEPATGPIYDDAGLLLQAAAAGEGVALARTALIGDDLAARRLVVLSDVQVEDSYGWFLVWRHTPRVPAADREAFHRWIEAEAARVSPDQPHVAVEE